METLIGLFMMIAPLSDELKAYLQSILKIRHVARKEVILRQGEVARHIYFVEKGLLRSYYLLDDNEVCAWFMKERDVFVSVQSFFFQEPSMETIEALEDSTLWGITFEQLQYAYKTFPEFNYHRGVLLEKYYGKSEMRHYMTRGQTMIKRYENLVKYEPELLQRVPNKYLASYMGMNESTFSIMRNQYLQDMRKGRA